MKHELNIDGKHVEPSSTFPTKRLSAAELNKLVSEVSNDLKERESQAVKSVVRKLKKIT